MPWDRTHLVLLPVAAAIAVLPLIVHGPSCGHDFTFHLVSWFEAAAQFRHGNLHPQWAFSPAWNAGEPRFVFYPPLSWTLGAILGMVLPWIWTPIVYTWLALTASGFATYRLARAYTGPMAALFASTLYLVNPYMLFTAYERTAYGELLAAAVLPLLFHAILKARPTIPAIAVPLALLWLTNAPAAVMGTYTLALLAAIRSASSFLAKSSSSSITGGAYALQLVATTALGTLLGLSLAAFYLLPAAMNRPLVQIAMVVIPGMRIDDNTLFHRTGESGDALAHDYVLHTASLIALLMLTLTAAAILLSHASGRSSVRCPRVAFFCSPATLPLALLTVAIAFLLTPLTLPLWHHAPELGFLQFPWRLLAIQAVSLALATALAFDRLRPLASDVTHSDQSKHPHSARPPVQLTAVVITLTLATTLTAAAYLSFHQPCDPQDTVQSLRAAFQTQQGYQPTDEYTPISADNDTLQPHNPPFWLSLNSDSPAPPGVAPGPAPHELILDSPVPQSLILNLRQYPTWHVILNGAELPAIAQTQTPRSDGLVNFTILAGRNHLILANYPPSHYGEATVISTLALLSLIVCNCKKPLFQTGRKLTGKDIL